MGRNYMAPRTRSEVRRDGKIPSLAVSYESINVAEEEWSGLFAIAWIGQGRGYDPVAFLRPSRNQGNEDEKYSGDGEIQNCPLQRLRLPPRENDLPRRTGCEIVGNGPRKDGGNRNQGVGPKRNVGKPIDIVLEAERKKGNKAGDHQHPPSLLPHPFIDPFQGSVFLDPALHHAAGGVAAH